MNAHRDDPIVAIATPAGRGGIGVVRVSFGAWSGTTQVGAFLAKLGERAVTLEPRKATRFAVHDAGGAVIDRGLALFFASPHSYTADDVLELQMHGGPVALRMIVARCLAVAADLARDHDERFGKPLARLRLAAPGEFTERAFLNDKLDLAQAEAVADLIEASSEAAVLGAQASLSGAFSQAVDALVARLVELRTLVEATLDFPDEEIDFLERSDARGRLERIADALATLLDRARQGALLRDGLTVVLVGRPNVGKSSLLNALAEAEVAIVTPIAGTTRDRIEETIHLEGIALHIVDTAGIRDLEERPGATADADAVERIGIARTWDAIAKAHVVLHIVDASAPDDERDEDGFIVERLPRAAAVRTIVNKIDLVGEEARVDAALDDEPERIHLSAKTGAGIDLLRHELLAIAGWQPSAESGFLARGRHVEALRDASSHVANAATHAEAGDRALDLFAEELRLAQRALDGITGVFTADDLLGEIFGRFCIGK